MVASHCPLSDTTACSTRDGCICSSNVRPTRFDDETSSSDTSCDVLGLQTWSEEGCEDGKMMVDDCVWKARGTDEEAEGRLYAIAGSTNADPSVLLTRGIDWRTYPDTSDGFGDLESTGANENKRGVREREKVLLLAFRIPRESEVRYGCTDSRHKFLLRRV